MEQDFKRIRALDYSHPYTTDVDQCIDLYRHVLQTSPRHVVELGSYGGVSAVALALAARWVGAGVLSVDLCDEIPASARRQLWEGLGLGFIASLDLASSEYLQMIPDDSVDFIFHDAAHGDAILPEYMLAWEKVPSGGVLAIHDFERITNAAEFETLLGARRYTVSIDPRGRQLVFLHKP